MGNQVIIEEGRSRDFLRAEVAAENSGAWQGGLGAARCLLEQCQLLVESPRRLFVSRHASARIGATDSVLLAEAPDELRNALAVGRRQKRAALIALAIVLDQLGKVLLEEWKKDRGRARLQE